MATISTETVYLKTGTVFKKKITYSGGYFRIKLPEELCVDMVLKDDSEKELKAENEQEVDRLFKNKLKEWSEVITVKEKVIFFESKFAGALLKEEKWEAWDKGKYKPYAKYRTNYDMKQNIWYFCHQDLGMDSGLGLKLHWGVYDKIKIKDKIDYKFVSGREFDSTWGRISSGATEIEYTEEREQFFLQLDESFARMIAKVYTAIGELTPDKLIQLTESGQKLLG